MKNYKFFVMILLVVLIVSSLTSCGECEHLWKLEPLSGNEQTKVCTICGISGFMSQYKIGDTGPGGGRIFYIADGKNGRPLSFTVTSTTSVFTTYTAYYLEAAPANARGGTGSQTTIRWSTRTVSPYPDVSGTLQTIGSGRNNTALIIAAEKAAHPSDTYIYAALACDNYTNNSLNDWFLPSRDELNQLYLQRSLVGINSDWFWSSSQSDVSNTWRQFIGNNGYQGTTSKANDYYIRAVRAF